MGAARSRARTPCFKKGSISRMYSLPALGFWGAIALPPVGTAPEDRREVLEVVSQVALRLAVTRRGLRQRDEGVEGVGCRASRRGSTMRRRRGSPAAPCGAHGGSRRSDRRASCRGTCGGPDDSPGGTARLATKRILPSGEASRRSESILSRSAGSILPRHHAVNPDLRALADPDPILALRRSPTSPGRE